MLSYQKGGGKLFKIALSILMSAILSLLSTISVPLKANGTLNDLHFIKMEENASSAYGLKDYILIGDDGEEKYEDDFSFSTDSNTNSSLPAKYDSRDYGIVTAVKNQYSTGSCWAFAAVSAAETSLLKKGLGKSDSLDLSEAHLTWFGLRSLVSDRNDPTNGDGIFSPSPYTDGGNWVRSVFALARWSGAQSEENAPFYPFPVLMGNYPESERYSSAAHLQNSSYIPPSDRDGIKNAIISCGSITVSYYSIANLYNFGESTSYYQDNVSNSNHTVTIVGWDDSYPKENFIKTPESNGAWLVKNSWGEDWGDDGYFYLSYCDTSLSYFVTYEMENSSNYGNNNQYDGFGYKGWAYLDGCEVMSMANIFTSKAHETLRAVSFHTVQPSVDYEIEIYKDIDENASPTSGTLVCTESGHMKYRGYKTVKLGENIDLPKDTRYSAVVTLSVSAGSNACIPLEYPDGFDGAHNRSYRAEEGQSFLTVRKDYDSWMDTFASGYNNICIKTFTDNISLRLKDFSPLRLRGGILYPIAAGTSSEYILNQFKNENTAVQNKSVKLFDKNGKEIDSALIAVIGDVDGDNDIDYDDLTLLTDIVCGKIKPDYRMYRCANINNDRRVDAQDISLLKKMLDS